MATFKIHEDEENTIPIKPTIVYPKLVEKQARTTFAVLNHNNVQRGNRAHASKTGNDLAGTKSKVFNDENEVPNDVKYFGGTKDATVDASVPVDKFKAFNVIEKLDNDSNKNVSTADDETIKIDAHDISSFRQPLQEITSQLETPISFTEMMSPMSIEKSIVIEDTIKNIQSTRNRFFDVEEYQMDIAQYLREAELKSRPKFAYMRKQPDITYSMRTILIDWLVEVGEEYKLNGETLCLAVSYIDRFLSLMSVVRAKLQLVGTAAMFIAAKYEEIYPPDVSEFIYITDHTYTKMQVFRMEQLLLKALTFDLFIPTLYTFLNLYATITKMSDECKFLAMYFCELSLLEADPYLQFLPSMISAAAVALARYNLDLTIWSTKLEEVTGYPLDSLKDVIFHLNRTHIAAVDSPQQAIQDKYKAHKYKEVSTLQPVLLNEESFVVATIRFKNAIELEESCNEHNNENVRKITSTLHFL